MCHDGARGKPFKQILILCIEEVLTVNMQNHKFINVEGWLYSVYCVTYDNSLMAPKLSQRTKN